MKLVYIAGPFSAKNREGVEGNIRRAALVGVDVAQRGGMPVVPHANIALPEYEVAQPYPFWIAGTLALMKRCDAVFMMENWKESSGARGEHMAAVEARIPVFYELGSLEYWLRGCLDRD